MTRTYRAAYWTDGTSDVRLTTEDQQDLPDDALLDIAIEEAIKAGIDMRAGRITVGDYTE